MIANLPNSRASVHLNLIRGLAAVAVLLYHIRYRFFYDFGDLAAPSVIAKVFYGATAFGHDAVIIFFVLSGYFISRSVTVAYREGRWSWREYLGNRLTRLYLVLLPGLALTFVWDQLGLTWFGDHAIYTGDARPWKHDFFSIASRLSPETLLGNILFQQSIRCPPYGSNDPLWSLSYEFWYYLAFPAGFVCLAARRLEWWERVFAAIVLCSTVLVMSRSMLVYMPIWLGGALIAHAPQLPNAKRYVPWLILASSTVFLCVLCACHIGAVRRVLGHSTVTLDYVNGISFMGFLWVVCHDLLPACSSFYTRLSRALSDMSYTLYVVHMPVLVFLRAAFVEDNPWTLNLTTMTCFVGLLIACVLYAWLVAFATERQTGRIRKWFVKERSRLPARGLGVAPQAFVSADSASAIASERF